MQKTIQTSFDPTGQNKVFDYNFALLMGIQNKCIQINPNGISFLIKDISKSLIKSIKKNKKSLFKHLNMILAIAKCTNAETIVSSMQYDCRYYNLEKLYQTIINATKSENHWIHHSLTVQGFIFSIGLAIAQLYEKSKDIDKKYKSETLYLRMLVLNKLKNKLHIRYFKNIMENKINSKMVKNLMRFQSSLLNKCGNPKCAKNYFATKYGKSNQQILSLIIAGTKIKSVHKWYKCKQCQMILYCGTKCQKYDWKYKHRQYCKKC